MILNGAGLRRVTNDYAPADPRYTLKVALAHIVSSEEEDAQVVTAKRR